MIRFLIETSGPSSAVVWIFLILRYVIYTQVFKRMGLTAWWGAVPVLSQYKRWSFMDGKAAGVVGALLWGLMIALGVTLDIGYDSVTESVRDVIVLIILAFFIVTSIYEGWRSGQGFGMSMRGRVIFAIAPTFVGFIIMMTPGIIWDAKRLGHVAA